MTEQLLLELTPLPLDIIKFCIQPFLTRPKQWENTFAHVLENVKALRWHCEENGNIIHIRDVMKIWGEEQDTMRLVNDYRHEFITLWIFGRIEY